MTATLEATPVEAPARLIAETRVDFRAAALGSMERAVGSGSTALSIDMSETEEVDASGLGTLVVLQKRARERGLITRLMSTRQPVRSLLAATKLEGLFEFH
jgi:anti-anti-sigma regulatory factor